MKEEQSNKNDTIWSVVSNILPIATTALTIITPFLYLLGLGYYQGVLNGFGVSSSFFPQSIENNLVHAYSLITIIAFKYFSIATVALLCLFVIFIIIFIVNKRYKLNIGIKFKTTVLRIVNSMVRPDSSIEEIIRKYEKIMDSMEGALYWVFIVIILLGTPVLAYSYGKQGSAKIISGFSSDNCRNVVNDKWSKCISIIDKASGKKLLEGLLVSQSSEFFALYNGNSTTIYHQSPNYIFVNQYLVNINKIKVDKNNQGKTP